jgi:anti-anti-sigma factor
MVHIDTDTTVMPWTVRLSVRGQLDLTAVAAFGEALTRAIGLRRPVDLDLDMVDFIDGSGLSTLMDATGRARSAGLRLRIVSASRCVRRLIEVTDTADRLPPLVPGARAERAQADRELALKALDAVRRPAFRI